MGSIAQNAGEALAKVNDLIKAHKVVVFSKSYCPYCDRVKDLLKQLSVQFYALELDNIGQEGALLQAALKTKSGQSTVPNVFINGNHIGGCDDTFRLHRNSKLVPMLK
jgi:glutaredoxin